MALESLLKGVSRVGSALLAASLLTSGCQYRIISRPGSQEYHLLKCNPSDQTLACTFLDSERSLGANPAHHIALHDILDKAKKTIKTEPQESREEKKAILKQIHTFLGKEGFTYVKNDKPFFVSLRTKEADCNELSILYRAIAKELELPLRLAAGPNHLMVMWDEDGYHTPMKDKDDVLWETTRGFEIDEAKYIEGERISQKDLHSGVYLRPFTEKEEEAYALVEAGRACLRAQNLEQAVTLFTNALKLVEKGHAAICAYQGRALARLTEQKTEEAMSDLALLTENHPDFSVSYVIRSHIRLNTGDYKGALRDCQRALELNQESSHAHCLRAEIRHKQGGNLRDNLDDVLSDLNRAIELDAENADAYRHRGEVLQARGDRGDKDAAQMNFAKYRELTSKTK